MTGPQVIFIRKTLPRPHVVSFYMRDIIKKFLLLRRDGEDVDQGERSLKPPTMELPSQFPFGHVLRICIIYHYQRPKCFKFFSLDLTKVPVPTSLNSDKILLSSL